MRRIAIVAVLTTAGLFALAGTAFGVAAKFHSASSSVNSGGALVVSFDERGLGNGNIDYTVNANATATYACINGGGKNPSAANKRTVEGSVALQGHSSLRMAVLRPVSPRARCLVAISLARTGRGWSWRASRTPTSSSPTRRTARAPPSPTRRGRSSPSKRP
jgi:hypothetical protein